MECNRRQFALVAGSLLGSGLQDSKPAAPSDKTAETTPLDRISWMAGHWVGTMGKSQIDENWAKPRGGRLMATSQFFFGTASSWHQEFLQISLTRKGRLVLEMRHGLTDEARYYRYESTKIGKREVVFENRGYTEDRAYRIRYAKDDAGFLCIEVSHSRKKGDPKVEAKDRVTRFVLKPAS